MARIYCAKCGKSLDSGDRFCRYCGSSDIKVEEAKKPDALLIKGDTLVRCNIFQSLDEKCPFSSYTHSVNLTFFGKEKVNSLDVVEGFQKGLIPKSDSIYALTEKFVQAYKKNVLVIPNNIKKVDRGEGFKSALEGCILYTIKYPENIEFTTFSLSKCSVLYFVLPKKIRYLCEPSFGELKLSSTPNSDGAIKLQDAHIDRLVVPSYIQKINEGGNKPYVLQLPGCQIDELVLEGCPEIISFNGRVETLKYNGSKSQFLSNLNCYGFAKTVICRDGTLIHENVGGFPIYTDCPKVTKMTDLRITTKNVNGFNGINIVIQYSGAYLGRTLIYGVYSNDVTVEIPDAIRSIDLTSDGKKITVYRPSNGIWIIDFDKYFK